RRLAARLRRRLGHLRRRRQPSDQPVGRCIRTVLIPDVAREIVTASVGPVRPGPGRGAAGGDTVSVGITLADAITALVAEKRAVGYKYDAEHQVLTRFEA